MCAFALNWLQKLFLGRPGHLAEESIVHKQLAELTWGEGHWSGWTFPVRLECSLCERWSGVHSPTRGNWHASIHFLQTYTQTHNTDTHPIPLTNIPFFLFTLREPNLWRKDLFVAGVPELSSWPLLTPLAAGCNRLERDIERIFLWIVPRNSSSHVCVLWTVIPRHTHGTSHTHHPYSTTQQYLKHVWSYKEQIYLSC